MPKQISGNELDAVLTAVARCANGGSVEDVRAALPFALPHRTLQRRIARLVAEQSLIVEGRGRASRYHVLRVPTAGAVAYDVSPRIVAAEPVETYVPISSDAEFIKRTVREPVQRRVPVGYNRAFLDAYRPNVSFYLPADIRQRLFEAGRSPESTQLPAGTYARQIFSRLMIDLSWNSSRLEGNTYSLLETERLLELGESADGKDAREAQMILNHKAAIELLVEQSPETGFNNYTVLNLHALLADNLLDARACGRLRIVPVGIAKTVYHPLEVPQLIEECFRQFLDTAEAIQDPFEQAFFAMVHLPYQPAPSVDAVEALRSAEHGFGRAAEAARQEPPDLRIHRHGLLGS